MRHVTEYAQAFSRLRSDTSRIRYPADTKHRAPHKPLLLLAVLDLAAEGSLPGGRVEPSPLLGELFTRYWRLVMPPELRPNIALPFFHLHRDGGFWRLVATAGNEQVLPLISQIRTLAELHSRVAFAQLDRDLAVCMSVLEDRAVLRNALIHTYFSPEAQRRLVAQAEINVGAYSYSRELLSGAVVAEVPVAAEYQSAVRSQGFRRAVVTAYNYRCTMCGVRIVTLDGHVAVEAAHIHPWHKSQNDSPTNGLALCPLCHWGFDEGLLGADQKRRILVSPQLVWQPNLPGHLTQLAQRPLITPIEERFTPDLQALSWHQRETFRAE